MSEAMAFGLDASMGFGYFDQSSMLKGIGSDDTKTPFFLGGKQGTLDANSLACRLLGIKLRKQSFTNADKAWEESKKLIDQDTPLILRVDMYYLPYYEFSIFEEGGHFGGHAITLAGYDEKKGMAYVGDTEFEEFQEFSIELLKKGRSSEEGDPYMYPKNTQFSMEPRPDGKRPPLAAAVKVAIQQVVNNMLRPSMNYAGIQGLKLFANSITSWGERLKGIARMTFELTHGYIETWGTGGASFRNLYKDFLEELLILKELKEGLRAWNSEDFNIIEDCIPIIRESAYNWTHFAQTLKNAADEHKDNCMENVDLSNLQGIALIIHKKEEELFKKLSKIKI
ncbi:MAG: DUF4872 domain-containing protein [Promethearchaeota archaeon]